MQKNEFLINKLRDILGDTATKADTLKKLYGRTKLFTLEDIEQTWNASQENARRRLID